MNYILGKRWEEITPENIEHFIKKAKEGKKRRIDFLTQKLKGEKDHKYQRFFQNEINSAINKYNQTIKLLNDIKTQKLHKNKIQS